MRYKIIFIFIFVITLIAFCTCNYWLETKHKGSTLSALVCNKHRINGILQV